MNKYAVKIRNELNIGDTVLIKTRKKDEKTEVTKVVYVRYKVLNKYRYIFYAEDNKGTKEYFQYHEVEEIIKVNKQQKGRV